MADKNDFDFSDRTKIDPMVKAPGNEHGAESMEEAQAAEGDPGNDRDLADKSGKQAREINFQTGRLEPVADHVGEQFSESASTSDEQRAVLAMDPDGDGEADGPDSPHVGAAEQSATDDPKRAGKAKK